MHREEAGREEGHAQGAEAAGEAGPAEPRARAPGSGSCVSASLLSVLPGCAALLWRRRGLREEKGNKR